MNECQEEQSDEKYIGETRKSVNERVIDSTFIFNLYLIYIYIYKIYKLIYI